MDALEVKKIVEDFEASEARGEAKIIPHEEVVELVNEMIARAKLRA